MQGGLSFGTDGSYEGYKTYASVGTKQKGYYLQASGTLIDSDGWMLSEKFTPTSVENGGLRINSDTRDWQVNLKAGLTPNATDDYSINYSKRSGSKGAPYHVTDPISIQRYWDWPYWDIESVYWLSHTKVGDASFVETKAYYNTFKNGLFSYDDAAQTTQALPKAFRSYYDDWAGGVSIEGGSDITTWDAIKGAFYYRRDDHGELQDFNVNGVKCGNPPCLTEPNQVTIEDIYSVALENTVHMTKQFDIVGGASYNWRDLVQAQDWVKRVRLRLASMDKFFGKLSYPLYTTTSVARSARKLPRYLYIAEQPHWFEYGPCVPVLHVYSASPAAPLP